MPDEFEKPDRVLKAREGEESKESQQSPVGNESLHDRQDLLHELQVHQIELEMQNDELRRTQERLYQAMEKYNDLYDFAPVGYVTSDIIGHILESNLTFADQLGVARSHLIHSLLWGHAFAPDRDIFVSHHDQVFRTGKRQSCELRLKGSAGRLLHVQLDSVPGTDVNGAAVCRTSATDITARKKAEEKLNKVHENLERMVDERTAKLRVSEEKFRKLSHEFHALLNAVSDTLILFSPSLEVLWTNRVLDSGLDKESSAAVRKYCDKLLSESSSSSEDDLMTRCFETSEVEVAVVSFDGAVLDVKAFPVRDAGNINSVLLWVSDVTEKMALQAEALQASHLAALGELAAGVAHEINNPITGIINYGQILINECNPESLEKDIGERIVKEGERVGRIVKTLLSYSRHGRHDKRPVRIQTVLEESLVLSQAQIRKEGIDLKIHIAEGLPLVNAYFQQLQQVFINIINNARHALNEKFPKRHEEKRLEINIENVLINSRQHVRIIFFDLGSGINGHDLPFITKPFFSTKAFGKGTGLGLTISQRIISEHDGLLTFESEKDEFTRVIIELPAVG
ncbi:PAS domain S-box-containing protein [Desulfonatronum thiosulfatophilum]|uniref:histidine kinase n=1 Tax=Desulfonatronum thiosulfatophilum TaxID=617002 RepID=A0A1G6A219_9BACT|nr:PAS domain-containing sensor histidine kinase [Desulfonatronum thiosulfatophilum]SDB02276.1 PAS domain S-box-containing protein [Desulfonatronum thiosulfatophilum]